MAIAALLIVGSTMAALNQFVLQPILQRWAADEAGLLYLAAHRWVQLNEEEREEFELTMAERHDLIVSRNVDLTLGEVRVGSLPNSVRLLRDDLAARLESPVRVQMIEDLVWVQVRVDGQSLALGLASERRAIQRLDVVVLVVAVGAVIVFFTSLLIVRRIVRPLQRVSAAAKGFRGAGDVVRLPEEGPRELRSLARSFNQMAREISALIANRTTFLAGVSHDLRTPLARMRVAMELLNSEQDRSITERILRNISEMEELLSVALQYAKGVETEHLTQFPLQELVESSIAAETTDAPNLRWEGDRSVVIRGAAAALRRVLQNLVLNAQRHSAKGSVEVRVRVLEDQVELAVLDRGPGIPPELRDRVFQPFFRVEGSNMRTGGVGLGLAIVKQLCDAHRWVISIHDRSGGGAEMRLSVPLVGTF